MEEDVAGKTPEELAAMLSTAGPRTPDEEADLLLSKLAHDPAPDEAIAAARHALEISEVCVTAWLIVASHAGSAGKALEFQVMEQPDADIGRPWWELPHGGEA
jgi:hypothetical protein